jgi:tetratricopeptide (TPR) repeat protein
MASEPSTGTAHNQITSIVSIASARYEQLAGKHLDRTLLSQMKSLDSLTTILDTENAKFSEFREKRRTFFHVMAVGIGPIAHVLDVFGGDIGEAFPPSSILFGGIKLLVDAAKGVSEKYDAILNLFGSLKDFAIRLEVYAKQTISSHLKDKLSEVLVALMEVLALSRQEIKHGRMWAFGQSMVGNGSQGSEAWDRLQKLVDAERGLVGAETLTEVKGVAIAVSDLSRQIEALSLVQNASKDDAESLTAGASKNVEKVRAALQPSSSSEDRYWQINRSRVSGTGDWIRKEQPFQTWMARERSVLWIAGNPGSGKSYIASNLISYLFETYPQKVQDLSHTSVAYAYFKDDDSKTRSFLQALKDMAFQIAQNDQVYAKYLATRITSAEHVSSIANAWRNLIADFFIQHPTSDSRAILLLDGLDEAYAADRDDFFDLAKDIVDGPEGRLQLVMLGRFQVLDEIVQNMELPDVLTIPITPNSNRDDIERYVEISVSKSAFLKRAPKDRRDEIVKKICDKAQGMFIWVDLMLKDIIKRTGITTWNKLLDALDKAPRGIDRMISHVLEGYSVSFQGDEDAARNLNELLTWVACTETPLTLLQLEGLLQAVEGPESDMIWLERSLRIQFASIFVLTRDDGLTTADLHRASVLQDDLGLSAGAGGIETAKESETATDAAVDDVENPDEFDSDPETTRVSFTHASIGDFFRNELHGMVRADPHAVGDAGNANPIYPPVGVDIKLGRVHCLKVCLAILCQYMEPAKSEEEGARIRMLAQTRLQTGWVQYLKNVDIRSVPGEDKKEIGRSLAKLLLDLPTDTDDTIVGTGSEYTDIERLLSVDNARLLVAWFEDPEVQQSMSEEARAAYVRQMGDGSQPLDVFASLVRYTAARWLASDDLRVREYAWYCVVLFRRLRYGVDANADLPAAIIGAAEWAGLEQNAEWHRRVGFTLRETKAVLQALPYFQKAIDLNPPFYFARQGVGRCLQRLGDVKKQIEWDERLLADLTLSDLDAPRDASLQNDLHSVYERLAQAYGALDRLDEALACYKEGQKAYNRCMTCINGAFAVLQFRNDWAGILAYMRTLDATWKPGSFMVDVLQERDVDIIRGAWEVAAEWTSQEEVQTVIKSYKSAILQCRQEKNFVAAVKLEWQLSRVLASQGDLQDAARICQRLVTTYIGTNAEKFVAAILLVACNDLARIALICCMEADGGPTSIEGQRHGAVIEWLVAGAERQSKGSGDAWEVTNSEDETAAITFKERSRIEKMGASYIQELTSTVMAMVVGHYYRLVGREKEAIASWRTLVRIGLRLLSDDDPANDEEAYELLWYALAAVGDDENALAMVHAYAVKSLNKAFFPDDEVGKCAIPCGPLFRLQNESRMTNV